MKLNKILSLVLALVMVCSCLFACSQEENTDNGSADLKGTYDVTLWVCDPVIPKNYLMTTVPPT